MSTLKECPFCGEKEVTTTQGIKGINAHYVIVCSFCGAITSFEGHMSKAACTKAWNRRGRAAWHEWRRGNEEEVKGR